MSFWDLSDGEQVDATSTEFEAQSGGAFDQFPNNTDLMAIIDEIKWVDNKEEYGGGRYINYRIQVVKPEAYKNRKSYFKLWVNGDNPNKDDDGKKKQGDKDKRLLGAMAVNAGGGLMKVVGTPTDEDLTRELTQKMMIFKVGAYEMERDGQEPLKGNYVMAVSPKSKGVDDNVQAQSPKPQSHGGGGYGAGGVAMDDEIPFAPSV